MPGCEQITDRSLAGPHFSEVREPRTISDVHPDVRPASNCRGISGDSGGVPAAWILPSRLGRLEVDERVTVPIEEKEVRHLPGVGGGRLDNDLGVAD